VAQILTADVGTYSCRMAHLCSNLPIAHVDGDGLPLRLAIIALCL